MAGRSRKIPSPLCHEAGELFGGFCQAVGQPTWPEEHIPFTHFRKARRQTPVVRSTLDAGRTSSAHQYGFWAPIRIRIRFGPAQAKQIIHKQTLKMLQIDLKQLS